MKSVLSSEEEPAVESGIFMTPVDERTSASMIRDSRFEPGPGAFLSPWLCKVPSYDFVLNTDKHTGHAPLPWKISDSSSPGYGE